MQDVKVHCGRTPKFMTSLKSEEKYHAALIHLVLGDLSAKATGGSRTLREGSLTQVSQDSHNPTTRSEQACHRTQRFPGLQSCSCVDMRSACSPAPLCPASVVQLVTVSPPFLPYLGLSYIPPAPFCGGSSFLPWATGIVSQRSLGSLATNLAFQTS